MLFFNVITPRGTSLLQFMDYLNVTVHSVKAFQSLLSMLLLVLFTGPISALLAKKQKISNLCFLYRSKMVFQIPRRNYFYMQHISYSTLLHKKMQKFGMEVLIYSFLIWQVLLAQCCSFQLSQDPVVEFSRIPTNRQEMTLHKINL